MKILKIVEHNRQPPKRKQPAEIVSSVSWHFEALHIAYQAYQAYQCTIVLPSSKSKGALAPQVDSGHGRGRCRMQIASRLLQLCSSKLQNYPTLAVWKQNEEKKGRSWSQVQFPLPCLPCWNDIQPAYLPPNTAVDDITHTHISNEIGDSYRKGHWLALLTTSVPCSFLQTFLPVV